MLKINGKCFMNIQEAVQWLLENNALPYQSTANYVANTEIAMSTLVDPSPAKIRVGSLVFFADSKVSTVTGITSNGFIVSDQYNNLVDDIAYVTGVSINGSGHLITTLSDGQSIDAGLIKQVISFSINASQHLIATYNDGSTNDLGAIFSGNVNISGNLTADSIIENTSGYSFSVGSKENLTILPKFVGADKMGNKVVVSTYFSLTRSDSVSGGYAMIGIVFMPSAVVNKLVGDTIAGNTQVVDYRKISCVKKSDASIVELNLYVQKYGTQGISISLTGINSIDVNDEYVVRIEDTFLIGTDLSA